MICLEVEWEYGGVDVSIGTGATTYVHANSNIGARIWVRSEIDIEFTA